MPGTHRMLETKCQICGVVFKAESRRLLHGDARFCSRKCHGISRGKLDVRVAKYSSSPDENGCINWTGQIGKHGYGVISSGKKPHKPLRAHRVAWELAYGTIPKGLLVCHRCDNKRCVNINHLFLGSHQDNMTDMVKKGRNTRGSSQHLAKLTEEDVIKIRQMSWEGKQYTEIAKIFGVSPPTVRRIAIGKNWKHVGVN